ncbi:MAG: phosphoglycerate dehydrogenase [Elusimicrobia bacterium]|nr:phosphoglycerate dehydrogenase [Elusimicrobiota bacterium]
MTMRIAVTTQTFGRNPVLRKELLKLFPDCVFNEHWSHPTQAELARLLQDCDGAVVGLEPVGEKLICRLPRLKIVSKYGVGLDNLDLAALARHDVTVGWTPGLNRLSVAEMTLGMMLALLRHVVSTCHKLKCGCWEKAVGSELTGKTVGIIGLGHVGKEVARLLQPFHCRILVNDILDQSAYCRKNKLIGATKGRIWKEADLVTLHTPLTPRTRGLVGRKVLSRMKKTAYLINTARGPIVDPHALKWALTKGAIAGAALDVYCEEPPTDQDLLNLPHLICTPHRAGSSREAVLAMGRSAIAHLKRFFLDRA